MKLRQDTPLLLADFARTFEILPSRSTYFIFKRVLNIVVSDAGSPEPASRLSRGNEGYLVVTRGIWAQ